MRPATPTWNKAFTAQVPTPVAGRKGADRRGGGAQEASDSSNPGILLKQGRLWCLQTQEGNSVWTAGARRENGGEEDKEEGICVCVCVCEVLIPIQFTVNVCDYRQHKGTAALHTHIHSIRRT